MKFLKLIRAFTLIEPGPVILLITHDGQNDDVMTITWSMVLSFSPRFAICPGACNHSYSVLQKTRECVLAVPGTDLLDKAIGIGTCSGKDPSKFEKFGLTRVPALQIRPPLIGDCLGNIECRVIEIIGRHNIIVLEGVADGRMHDRLAIMVSKLPSGV